MNDYDSGNLAKLACISLSGLLEKAIRIYSNLICQRHCPQCQKLSNDKFSNLNNPKSDKFQLCIDYILPNKSIELSVFLTTNGRGDAIDSIMNNRHLIAHGNIDGSNITVTSFNQYYSKCKEVIRLLDSWSI